MNPSRWLAQGPMRNCWGQGEMSWVPQTCVLYPARYIISPLQYTEVCLSKLTFQLFQFVHLLDFMLLYSEKVLARSSFHAACSETLLWINEFNWLFMPSFFTYHVACSTFEWDCLWRLKLVDFWELAGSTLSWVHKSLAELKVISKHIVPRMVLNFLYSTALLLPHVAPLRLFCHPRLDEQACQFHCFLCERNKYVLGNSRGLGVAWAIGMGLFSFGHLFPILALLPNPLALRFHALLPGRWIGK